MYTFKKQIIGVKSFLTYNSKLYFEKDNDIYIDEKKSDLPELPRITKNGYLVINKGKNKFVIMQSNSVCTEYKNEKSIAYYINSFCLLSKSEAIGGIISYDSNLMKVIYENQGIYDITTGNLKSLFKIDNIFSFVLNTPEFAIFQKDATYLAGYSIKTNQPLWQFDLSQLGTFIDNYSKEVKSYKVEKFITIYDNQLYIALNLPSHTIISINVQTGKLINKWENIPYTIGANYDEFEQIIFGFEYKNYWQINLKTSEFNIIDIENTFKQKNLKSVNSQVNIPINQTHYLIKLETPVDEENSRIDVGLGLYNKITKQLDWHYVFDKNVFIGANDPKMTNDKIYQLDADGNLYIFEKEENNPQT